MAAEPGPMPAWPSPVRRLAADDIEVHAANLAGWQQRYEQLSCGAFCGEIAELWFDEVQVFRERTSRAVRQNCSIRPGSLWCGVTLEHDGSRIESRLVGAGGVMVAGSSSQFELFTPDGHDILGIVVELRQLEAMAEAIGRPIRTDALSQPGWLACASPARALLARRLQGLLEEAGNSGHGDAQARGFARQAAMEALLAVLASPRDEGDACLSFERRRRLVRAACEAVTEPAEAAPTVSDLCHRLHVSRRTLQYAFETVVGTSPVSHLRALRLNAVRRELRSGAARSVQDAAARHGFWSFSQFGSDYRRQFDERPSQTLARARESSRGVNRS